MSTQFSAADGTNALHKRGRDLSRRLKDKEKYKQWIDAVLPHLQGFMAASGVSVEVIISDEFGADIVRSPAPEDCACGTPLKLIRSDDYGFRIASDASCISHGSWLNLINRMRGHLQQNGVGCHDTLITLGSLDSYLCSENHCPGMKAYLDGILGQ